MGNVKKGKVLFLERKHNAVETGDAFLWAVVVVFAVLFVCFFLVYIFLFGGFK